MAFSFTRKRDFFTDVGDVGDTRLARRMRRAGRSVEWRDIDLTTTAAHGETSEQTDYYLPPWLLRDRVFQFLAAPPRTYVSPNGFDIEKYEKQLSALRGVCQQWQKLVQFLLLEVRERARTIEIMKSSASKAKRMLTDASKEGSKVEELTMIMGEYCGFFLRSFFPYPRVDVKLFANPDWCTPFFTSYANLVRLDLSMLAFECVAPMIRAASSHALQLQELVLQCGRGRNEPIDAQRATTAVLMLALRQWHQHNGGLRLITIPSWVTGDPLLYADFFIAVTSYCPNAQFVLGRVQKQPFNQSLRTVGSKLPIGIWTAFCERCTQLKEMWWMIAPWTPEHVQAFTGSQKREVEVLTMEPDFSEGWQDLHDLSSIENMVKSSPKLRVFSLNFLSAPPQHRFHEHSIDKLVDVVNEHCPLIEEFKLRNSAHNDYLEIRSASIEALLQKPTVREVNASTVAFENDTLVKILTASQWHGQPRKIVVDLTAVNVVHNAAHRLLQCLLAAAPDRLKSTMLELHVCSSAYVDATHSIFKAKGNAPFTPSQELSAMTQSIQELHAKTVTFIHVQVERHHVKHKVRDIIAGVHLFVNIQPTARYFLLSERA